jgi:hypothetical protein
MLMLDETGALLGADDAGGAAWWGGASPAPADLDYAALLGLTPPASSPEVRGRPAAPAGAAKTTHPRRP